MRTFLYCLGGAAAGFFIYTVLFPLIAVPPFDSPPGPFWTTMWTLGGAYLGYLLTQD